MHRNLRKYPKVILSIANGLLQSNNFAGKARSRKWGRPKLFFTSSLQLNMQVYEPIFGEKNSLNSFGLELYYHIYIIIISVKS